jgi:hypothetical protein
MPGKALGALPMRRKFLAEAAMSLFQLAEAVEALEPPAAGRRHVEVIEKGDDWVMYRVASDTQVRLGYADWHKGYTYKVFAMIDVPASCAFYNGDGIVVGHRLTARDIADLLAVRTARDLLKLVWNRVNKALQGNEGEPCEGVWVLR